MNKIYAYLAAVSILSLSLSAGALVPTWGYGEVITQMVDNTQSNAVSDLIQTKKDLMKSVLDGLKGSYSSSSVRKNLKKTLTEPSEAITGQYEGLQNVLGKGSSYGQIRVKKCGASIPEVIQRVKAALTLPASESNRNDLITKEQNTRESNRNASIESAGTTTLAKAWIVESESSKVAEAISKTQKELDKATSQMTVLVTILRLQEETQKNVNTRLSLLGDELISTGLSALDSGL